MTEYRLKDVAIANAALVSSLFEQYEADPKSVSPEWVDVFDSLAPNTPPETKGDSAFTIARLIEAFRTHGYLKSSLSPLKNGVPDPDPLKLNTLGFSESDLNKLFPTLGLLPEENAPLSKIIDRLQKVYGDGIGFEYMGRGGLAFEKWLQEHIEINELSSSFSQEDLKRILKELTFSEFFESFIHTKYPGQKRFSLEGGEALIPMLSFLIDEGARLGIDEWVFGMAHRGRLNVLASIFNKSCNEIFAEFKQGFKSEVSTISGDVKYHKGYAHEINTAHGHPVKLTLSPNPSHLESIDPVVLGEVKARQVKRGDLKQEHVTAVLIHGDAALAGQGVVYESLQLYRLNGYSTGGTVHIVINNHIGFTTSPEEARSTPLCTDIAKTFNAPVFHVNAEDPKSCVFAALLAIQIRQKFHIDVFIDLNCYRKYGHNESDEPAFTQPLEYQEVRGRKTIRQKFVVDENFPEEVALALETQIKTEFLSADSHPISPPKQVAKKTSFEPISTGVSAKILQEIAQKYCEIPPGFQLHPKLVHLLKERLAMVIEKDHPLDWGMGEILAFATLLWEGIHLRLSGQDCGRGTFSHRHALLFDQEKGLVYSSLEHLKENQGRSDIVNSPLSEFAALGFEYGYSVAYPEALVIWEAQFGDFSNSAQVIIDQYIAAGEAKWGQTSDLVLLLPHGYEGQGPEHSSARLERYLTLAADHNLTIANPTTPVQFFHLLRRQALDSLKRPLICLTPKSLLRHPECVSPLADFETGSFKEIIDDGKLKSASSLLFCSGKIYYELAKFSNLACIRIEQLYPLDIEKLKTLIALYKDAKHFAWVQEEPQNMGAWSYIQSPLRALLAGRELLYIGRSASASPATGSPDKHKIEHDEILKAVLLLGKDL